MIGRFTNTRALIVLAVLLVGVSLLAALRVGNGWMGTLTIPVAALLAGNLGLRLRGSDAWTRPRHLRSTAAKQGGDASGDRPA